MTAPTRRQRRVMLLLLVASLAFVTLDYRSGSFSRVRSAAGAVFGPVQRGFTAMFAPVGRFVVGIPDAGRSRGRIEELQRRNADLQRQLNESQLTVTRGTALARLGLLAGLGHYRLVPAVVVSLGPSVGFEWTATIDAGNRDGVAAGMTVVDVDGLVGRVKEVTRSAATVVLAIDPGSSVGVRLAGSDQLGVASGAGRGPLSFTPLDPQTQVRVGDRLVTGPYGGTTYAPGIPVGDVTAVSGSTSSGQRTATVRPYVTFTSLDLVGVVVGAPPRDPRDALLGTP